MKTYKDVTGVGTCFHRVQYGPWTITTMNGDSEGSPFLVSIAGRGLPKLRVLPNGTVEQLGPNGADGVGFIIFGQSKGDHPGLGSIIELQEPYGEV